MHPDDKLRPKHVAKYLEQREDDGAAVRGNREKALLSHCFTKAMVQGWVDANPCRGVHRNRERQRERMIALLQPGADDGVGRADPRLADRRRDR
jgi:hypothetical protein